MSDRPGEVIRFQRPSAYWMGRAARHRREGNRRRAAALLRHAVALSPTDSDLRLQYARALQDMACYEASNRAAFGALTLDPRRYVCYGLIGRNMLALGNPQEAMDAFSRYLWAVRHSGGEAEFDEELDQLEDYENSRPRLKARFEAQLGIASRRLADGDLDGAEHALDRARPLEELDDRYDSLRALLLQARGDGNAALRVARRACKRNPQSARAFCSLAGAWYLLGNRARCASALLSAAARCVCPQDEQLVCYSAVNLGFPELALCVLRRALKENPDRLPSIFDACVIMLRLGRLEDAESFVHHCRALDPSDVPSLCAYRTIAQWRDLELKPAQVRKAAEALPFYPMLSPAQHNDCLLQLTQALGNGLDAFCAQLQQDETLYSLLMYELGSAEHQLSRLIPLLAAYLPRDFAERLLREVLVQPSEDDGVKRFAASALIALDAKPPYVVWHAGRIAEIDPAVQSRQDASFSHMMLVRRMADLQRKTGDFRLMTHALHLLNRMGPRRRNSIVRDMDRVFRAALEQHYLMTYGLPDNQRLHKLLQTTVDGRRRVRTAFYLLCQLVPLPEKTPRGNLHGSVAPHQTSKGGNPDGTH